jgi:hypothetical protein
VIVTAIQRGGKPMVNGRQITEQQFPNIDVGISQDSSTNRWCKQWCWPKRRSGWESRSI